MESTELVSSYIQALDRIAMVIIVDPEGRITRINDNFLKVLEYESKDLLGIHVSTLRSRHTTDEIFSKLWETVQSGQTWQGELSKVTRSGQVTWAKAFITPIFSDGKITSFLSVQFDITAQKVAEFELNESIQFIEKIAHTIPGVIYIFNLSERNNVFSNDQLAKLLGYSSEELIGMGQSLLKKIIYPEDLKLIERTIAEFRRRKDGEIVCFTYRLVTKNKKILWFNDRAQVFRRDKEGRPLEVIGVLEDVTERVIAEQKLQIERARSVHSAKLASLGQMAGGIAHEINNPLSMIIARAEQVRRMVQSSDLSKAKAIESLDKIEATAYRIAKIVKGLRTFSRAGDGDPFAPTSLSSIIEDVLNLCKERFANSEIELSVNTFSDISIECRAVQIAQVILNLLHNSYDAIAGHSKKWVAINISDQSDKVEVRITDSGSGISPEIAHRMGEPFFTTKEPGKGTGLGLSISEAIVSEHQGSLSLDPNSKNTTFVLILPKKQEQVRKSLPSHTASELNPY